MLNKFLAVTSNKKSRRKAKQARTKRARTKRERTKRARTKRARTKRARTKQTGGMSSEYTSYGDYNSLTPRGNDCMYYRNGEQKTDGSHAGNKEERDQDSCRKKSGCRWGTKMHWTRPIRGASPRCHKERR